MKKSETNPKKFNDALGMIRTKQVDSLHKMLDSAYDCLAFIASTNPSLQADCLVLCIAIDNLHEKI